MVRKDKIWKVFDTFDIIQIRLFEIKLKKRTIKLVNATDTLTLKLIVLILMKMMILAAVMILMIKIQNSETVNKLLSGWI